MSFFNELKRRNVFRVGIAYLIGSWLLAQIAELLLDTFNAPEWTMKFIFVVLLIGFPIAIFFAWAFELTPDGIKKEKDVDRSKSRSQVTGQKLNNAIVGILVVALVYFAIDKFVLSPGRAQPGSDHFSQQASGQTTVTSEKSALTPNDAAPTDAGPAINSKSVAVLPFVNMSSDPEQEYFSDGITEEIINALVKIPGLSVPARTSVFGFKGQHGDVRKIGEQLGVAHVLEGSIRSQGKQVRITAQLIKIDDGFHMWSETYDRKLDNIFVVQEEIAKAIATVLTGELGMDIDTVPNKTVNMEAYDSYLQGRALLHKRGLDNLDKAVALFKQTTELDPEFAPAWAAMALSYSVMDLSPDLLALAIDTAEHALSLDPGNVDALNALASALRDSWRWSEAEPYFDRAMAIDPQSSELLEDYAEFLGMTGRFDEYLSVSANGYAIDPRLGPLVDCYVSALMIDGQFDRSIEMIEQYNRSIGPDQVLVYWHESIWKIIPLMAMGDSNRAIESARSISPERMATPIRDAIIGLLENPGNEDARTVLRNAISVENPSDYDSDIYTAWLVLVFAGDIDFVINQTIIGSRKYSFGNVEPIWSPIYAKFRQHPRFGEYLEILNLPDYWDQAGWPDICQRHDDGRIECQ